jgi:hypothetical protein
MAAEVSVVNDDGTLKLLRLLRAYVKEGVSNAEARKGLMVVAGEHLRRLPPLGQRARELSKALATVQEPKSRPSNQFWLVATLRSSEDEKQTWLHSTLTDFKDGSDAPRDRAAVVVPVRQILERLEMATNDSWPATSERRVKHYPGPESALSARQLVDQAFKEYEKARGIGNSARWDNSRRRRSTIMPTIERPDLDRVMAKFDSFDAVTERAAISVMKLGGWIATIAVVLYGLVEIALMTAVRALVLVQLRVGEQPPTLRRPGNESP